jgi:putative ABC transport system ATP-binding protein
MIKATNITRTYEGAVPTHALKGISLEIQSGEFVAIMGKSGSGKSTLLRILGLLDTPTEGNVYIDNIDVHTLSDDAKTEYRLKNLGFIFQDYALLSELTALENVSIAMKASRQLTNKEIEKTAIEYLAKVELSERIDHLPNELSGGEQQRVSIARAIAHKPKILFADEPCANLDSQSSQSIMKLLSQLNTSLRQTIVFVSHDPEDKKWVHRVIYLKDGLITKAL